MSNEMIIVDTPKGIDMVRLITLAHGLTLEINTGMKAGPYALTVVARGLGVTNKKTKKGVLRDVVAAIRKAHPDYMPSKNMTQAMAPVRKS